MESYIDVGGARLWTSLTDRDASKPYLCLINGGPGLGDYLSDVGELLNERFNIIRFEQRGCGRSTADGAYDIDTTLMDIEAIREFYGIERFYLLGHSFGAGTALFYALKQPSRCLGLICVSSAGLQNDSDWYREWSENEAAQSAPERDIPPDFNFSEEVNEAGRLDYRRYIKRPTLLREAAELDVPVLFISGERDIRPLWPAVQLAELLKRADLEIMRDCNHFPWLQNSGGFREHIFSWLNTM